MTTGFLEDFLENMDLLYYPPKYTLACILRCEKKKRYKITQKDFSEGSNKEKIKEVIEEYKKSEEFEEYFGEK